MRPACTLLPIVHAILRGAYAGEFFEGLCEVTLIAKASVQSDIGERFRRLKKFAAGKVDSFTPHQLANCTVVTASKLARESDWVNIDRLRNLVERQVFEEARLDQLMCLTKPAGWQAFMFSALLGGAHDGRHQLESQALNGEMRHLIRRSKLLIQLVSETNRQTTTKIAAIQTEAWVTRRSHTRWIYFDPKQIYRSPVKILRVSFAGGMVKDHCRLA